MGQCDSLVRHFPMLGMVLGMGSLQIRRHYEHGVVVSSIQSDFLLRLDGTDHHFVWYKATNHGRVAYSCNLGAEKDRDEFRVVRDLAFSTPANRGTSRDR